MQPCGRTAETHGVGVPREWLSGGSTRANGDPVRANRDPVGASVKIGLAQLNSGQNKATNLAAAAEAIARLAEQGAGLVVLPEMFNFHGLDDAYPEAAETIPGPSTAWARDQARQHSLFLHCGSLAERRGDKIYNTSVVFAVTAPSWPTASYICSTSVSRRPGASESSTISAGSDVVTVNAREHWACYLVTRAPLPSTPSRQGRCLFAAAFTATGTHWDLLAPGPSRTAAMWSRS